MLLSNRRKFLLGSLCLVGCGYAPVRGKNSQTKELLSSIFVQDPKNRAEFELVRNLEKQFGRLVSRRYDLNYNLNIKEEKIVVSASQAFERYSLVGSLKYKLVDEGGLVILANTAKSFTGYSATGTALATEVAKRDAQDRLMVILADQVLHSLLIMAKT